MAITLAFYNDSGLTSPLTSLAAVQANDGNSPAVDRVVYLGSTAVSKKFQAASNPGVAAVTVSIADSAVGAGVEAEHVKLATSAGGLDSATAGAALNVGTQILSGAANAIALYVRIDTPALADGTYTDLSFVTPSLIEVAA